MALNVGGIDRAARIVAGAGLIGAALMGVIGGWGWIGVVPLATGLFKYCPVYAPFGLSSCSTRK